VPHRLLIVDANSSFAPRLRRYLSTRGFEVDCASELEEAQALLTQVRYAAMIAAWRLKGTSGAAGLELVTHVQNHAPWTRTILLTGRAPEDVGAEARARGTDVVLEQRPSPAEIGRLLGALLS
jgi:ActR/RegA family two-component response regulator